MNRPAALPSTYAGAIRYLFGLQGRGMKFGLRGIRRLSAFLGHPERRLVAIHVAGTNGKGSTAAMIASVFTASGLRVGLYTSPHVLDFSERIRIGGRPIARAEVTRLVRRLAPAIERHRATFFEAATAMAFRHFVDAGVDLAVVETGLGGRLDATNVLSPILTVITGIAREHTQYLGSSLASIAREKGGIVKANVPCVLGEMPPTAERELRNIARLRGAPFISSRECFLVRRSQDMQGSVFDLTVRGRTFVNLRCDLAGSFQLDNVKVAVPAILASADQLGIQVNARIVEQGFAAVMRSTGLSARLHVVRRRPLVIADVAHNPDAMARLVESLKSLNVPPYIVVFGVMADKDAEPMLRQLATAASRVFVVSPRTSRARPVDELMDVCRRVGVSATAGGSVGNGLSLALRASRGVRPVLITGSFFVVGEALARMRRKKYLTINQ